MMPKISNLFIVFALFWVNCDCLCEFPSELRGSWISSDHGNVEFNSTSVTGYAIPSDICKNTCPSSLMCFEKSGSLYLLRSPTFISGGVPLRMYVCWDITEIFNSKVIYYPAIQDINTFTNDRAVFLGDNFTDMTSVCNRINPYPPQSYNVFIKRDTPLGSVSVCPNAILGRYKEDITECLLELNSCTVKTSISITSSSCSPSPFYIGNGTANCIYSTIYENTTFLTVYNQDENVDNINTFRFTCLAIEMISGKLFVSENPLACFDNQSARVPPTTKGRVYEFIPSELCPINNSTTDNSLTTAEITGISLGLLFLLTLLVFLLCCCCCLGKCRKKHKEFDLEKDGKSGQESDEVRLLRAKKGGKLPDDTLSTDSGVGVYKDGSGLHNDGSDLSGERNRTTKDINRMEENGEMVSREGSDIYKDINAENTTLPKLLTSTRYGKNRKLVVDKYGRQILVEADSGDEEENREDNSTEKRANSARSSYSRNSNRSVGKDRDSSEQLNDVDNNSYLSRKTKKVKRLLPNGTEIEEEITDDEVDLSEELDEAGCKRENSFYVFQPGVPISGRLTSRRKEEKRNQVEKPRKTRKGFFNSLAKKFRGDHLSEDRQEVDKETAKNTTITTTGVNRGDLHDNRTPYMEEYYYKKAMEQLLEDEGFFEDPESKRKARDIFNINTEGDPRSIHTNKINSISVNTNSEQPNARSTPIASRRGSQDSVKDSDSSEGRHGNSGFSLHENTKAEQVSNFETVPSRVRKQGIVSHLTPACDVDDASDIRSSTPHENGINSSTNLNQKRNQGHVIFVESCSDSEKSTLSKKPVSSKFPRLPDLHLSPVKARKTSQHSVSSWSSGLYDDIHLQNAFLRRHPTSDGSLSPTSGMKTNIKQRQRNEKRKSQQSDFFGSQRESNSCQSAFSLDASLGESGLSHHSDIDCPPRMSKGNGYMTFSEDQTKKLEEQSSLFLRVPRPSSGRILDGLLSPRNDQQRKRKLTTNSLNDWYISVTPTSARLNYPVAEKDRMKKLLEELYLDKKYLDRLTDQTVDAECESERKVSKLSADCSDYLLDVARYWEQHPPLPPIPPATQIGFKLQRAATTLPDREHTQSLFINPPARSKSNF